jgi:hypothetical protein
MCVDYVDDIVSKKMTLHDMYSKPTVTLKGQQRRSRTFSTLS